MKLLRNLMTTSRKFGFGPCILILASGWKYPDLSKLDRIVCPYSVDLSLDVAALMDRL